MNELMNATAFWMFLKQKKTAAADDDDDDKIQIWWY